MYPHFIASKVLSSGRKVVLWNTGNYQYALQDGIFTTNGFAETYEEAINKLNKMV